MNDINLICDDFLRMVNSIDSETNVEALEPYFASLSEWDNPSCRYLRNILGFIVRQKRTVLEGKTLDTELDLRKLHNELEALKTIKHEECKAWLTKRVNDSIKEIKEHGMNDQAEELVNEALAVLK